MVHAVRLWTRSNKFVRDAIFCRGDWLLSVVPGGLLCFSKRRKRHRLGFPAGLVGEDDWLTLFLTAPSISIRGGTDEIQRNIVGERVLGLPPEPRPDKGVPFNEVPRSAQP